MMNKESDKTQTLTLIIVTLRQMTYTEINKVEPRESLKKVTEEVQGIPSPVLLKQFTP